MQAHREVIDSRKLAGIVDLPKEFKETELELIIFPVQKKGKNKQPKSRIKLTDLPQHHLGRELSPIDREHIYTDER